MASKRVVTVEAPTLNKITPISSTAKPVSAQANILSAAIKRKAYVSIFFLELFYIFLYSSTNDKKDDDSASKVARVDPDVKAAASASAVIGHIAGLVHYEASRLAVCLQNCLILVIVKVILLILKLKLFPRCKLLDRKRKEMVTVDIV